MSLVLFSVDTVCSPFRCHDMFGALHLFLAMLSDTVIVSLVGKICEWAMKPNTKFNESFKRSLELL